MPTWSAPTRSSGRPLTSGGLLAWIGCHADSQELTELFGDDIDFRAASYEVDWRGAPFASVLLRHAGSGRPVSAHTARLASFAVHARAQLMRMISSHCQSAGNLAGRLGLPRQVGRGLTFTFERWDGSGLPSGAAGADIPLGMRIVHLADVAEVHLRSGGGAAAVAMARQRSGTQFDPALVNALTASPAWPAPMTTVSVVNIEHSFLSALPARPDDLTPAGPEA